MKTKYVSQLLLLIVCSSFLSCKKKNPQPIVSDSTYNHARLYIDKQRYIYRNGTGNDSIANSLMIEAGFGDSSYLYAFNESVGNVSINDLDLGSKSPCHYDNYNVTDSEMAHYNTAFWKVVSPNGVTDLEYDAGSMAYYQDTVPYIINRSSGFSIKVNPALAANTDSVKVSINTVLYKTVSIQADSIYFSPSELSVLSVNNNWSGNVLISCIRHYTTSINGRGFEISSYRQLIYNVNVN